MRGGVGDGESRVGCVNGRSHLEQVRDGCLDEQIATFGAGNQSSRSRHFCYVDTQACLYQPSSPGSEFCKHTEVSKGRMSIRASAILSSSPFSISTLGSRRQSRQQHQLTFSPSSKTTSQAHKQQAYRMMLLLNHHISLLNDWACRTRPLHSPNLTSSSETLLVPAQIYTRRLPQIMSPSTVRRPRQSHLI